MNFSQACFDLVMDSGWNGVFISTPVMEVYGGTMPSAPELAVPAGNDHFLTIALANPPWANASNGVKAQSGTWSDTFTVGGDPTWFRIRNSGDAAGEDYTVARIDGTLGTDASSDIVMSQSSWLADDSLAISTFDLVGAYDAAMGLPGTATLA
jgi:hypothetical protein